MKAGEKFKTIKKVSQTLNPYRSFLLLILVSAPRLLFDVYFCKKSVFLHYIVPCIENNL